MHFIFMIFNTYGIIHLTYIYIYKYMCIYRTIIKERCFNYSTFVININELT